ncbi:hypothetical protein CPLU01_00742 [Colletotrichum plurivorum]|uniref:Uncharacterized protein n=1 Tax=Colletotrichum plurivorum TaxID=2175906 RepID=A0A8H6U5N0_9PEZI|nr:hypothetical protein CPLU01_00742 [Colletotrichum plurivorum]
MVTSGRWRLADDENKLKSSDQRAAAQRRQAFVVGERYDWCAAQHKSVCLVCMCDSDSSEWPCQERWSDMRPAGRTGGYERRLPIVQVVWIIDARCVHLCLGLGALSKCTQPSGLCSWAECTSMHSTITEASRACLISYGTLYGYMLVVAREKLPTQEAESRAVVHVFDGYLGLVLDNIYRLRDAATSLGRVPPESMGLIMITRTPALNLRCPVPRRGSGTQRPLVAAVNAICLRWLRCCGRCRDTVRTKRQVVGTSVLHKTDMVVHSEKKAEALPVSREKTANILQGVVCVRRGETDKQSIPYSTVRESFQTGLEGLEAAGPGSSSIINTIVDMEDVWTRTSGTEC